MRLIIQLCLVLAFLLGLSLPAAAEGLADTVGDVKGTVDDVRDVIDDDDEKDEAKEEDEKGEDGDDKKE